MKPKSILLKAMTAALLFAAPLLTGAAKDKDSVDAAYQQSVDKSKAELVDDRKQAWLTLAGLFWLKPGENTFGSDPANAIVFPKGPAHAGVFELNSKEVTLKLSPDAHAIIDGKPVTTARLDPDTSGKP